MAEQESNHVTWWGEGDPASWFLRHTVTLSGSNTGGAQIDMGLISEGLIRSGHRAPSPSPGNSGSSTGLAWRKKSWGQLHPGRPRVTSLSGLPGDQVRSSTQSDRAAESRPAWTSHPPPEGPEGCGDAAPGAGASSRSHTGRKSPLLGLPGHLPWPAPAPERAVIRTRTEAAEPERASGEVMQCALKAATLHARTPANPKDTMVPAERQPKVSQQDTQARGNSVSVHGRRAIPGRLVCRHLIQVGGPASA